MQTACSKHTNVNAMIWLQTLLLHLFYSPVCKVKIACYSIGCNHRSRKKTDSFSKKNTGVEERAIRDKLQLKAETDGSASYAALERKAQLYDKLVRGELSDEEDRERYSVDFLRKGLLEDEFRELETEGQVLVTSAVDSRKDVPPEPSSTNRHSGIGWSSDKVARATREHKVLMRQVNEKTIEARQQAAEQRHALQRVCTTISSGMCDGVHT